MTTGVATTKLPAHLEPLRQMYVERYLRAVENPDPFDIDALERAAGLQAKFAYAIADPECPASTLDILHRLLHRELKALKVLRVQQESRSSGTTPAEVVASIIRRVEARKKEIEARQIEPPPRVTVAPVAKNEPPMSTVVTGRVVGVESEDVSL